MLLVFVQHTPKLASSDCDTRDPAPLILRTSVPAYPFDSNNNGAAAMKQTGVAALGTDGESIIVLSVDMEWGE